MIYHRAQCLRLGFGIICQMAWRGLGLGTLGGGLVGFVLGGFGPSWMAFLILVGMIAGSIIGLLLGFAIGSTLVLFSLRGLPTSIEGYRLLARAISLVWIIGAALWFASMMRVTPEGMPLALLAISSCGLIAFAATWYACGKVVAWVEKLVTKLGE